MPEIFLTMHHLETPRIKEHENQDKIRNKWNVTYIVVVVFEKSQLGTRG